jgi:PiT family inorganic phosphate transporter
MWKLLSGFFLGWTLGANDSANVFGTGVVTGSIKYRTAIWLTSIFVLLGSFIEGTKCMNALGELSSLLPIEAFFCTLAAAVSMALLTYLALPASASQAIVGGVVGIGIATGIADIHPIFKFLFCWVLTPLSALLFAILLHKLLGYAVDQAIPSLQHRNLFYRCGILLAGCYGAYCLGGNNVANVTGVYVGAGILSETSGSLIGGVSIALGVLTYSRKVMNTVGKGIVPLDPFSALVVVLAQALTLHLFTQVGVPVSSTQAVVGAVVGIGLIGDTRTINSTTLLKISVGWVITPALAGLVAFVLSVSCI